ncbi:MAG: hypothetical protein AABY32_04405 [Nanoarchaeota archaeon]
MKKEYFKYDTCFLSTDTHDGKNPTIRIEKTYKPFDKTCHEDLFISKIGGKFYMYDAVNKHVTNICTVNTTGNEFEEDILDIALGDSNDCYGDKSYIDVLKMIPGPRRK